MLIQTLDLLTTDPLLGLVILAVLCLSLLIGITVHEFSHAYVALTLGDHTAHSEGRVTLNPIRHLDPLGAALILFVGFGWGKPVPVQAESLSVGARAGMALVSLAGPLSNLVAALVFAAPLILGFSGSDSSGAVILGLSVTGLVVYALRSAVRLNLILAVFNLLPIAPLDGFKVLLGLLPPGVARVLAKSEPYGPAALLLVLMLGFFSDDLRILQMVLLPPVDFLSDALLGRSL